MAGKFRKFAKQFIVPAGREQEFRDAVEKKYPGARVSEGRRTTDRAGELMYTYFSVTGRGVPEDAEV